MSKRTIVMYIFHVVMHRGTEVHEVYLNIGSLQGKLEAKVFNHQPYGLMYGNSTLVMGYTLLYGLKHAPSSWYITFCHVPKGCLVGICCKSFSL